ncbi:LytTR family DNA-binding domain-containing protein [Sabulilitoribacter arenilitoris]|uniref:LytTR family DNA-binding domain-containing protein n=1 Tax=Wocania arenilitoris TaxID=2044858 RepID=A0AAE3EPV3_9FLAO|nr:LytTR family DNA-binding domain-containing protein [Wocania arenilitoris]MCF7568842.1 LytTR family DNA-binding domain-containing protein [Wocania arenilitoris]
MRCLIVDDDPLICDLLEHFCTKLGIIFNITISYSGFESITLINQNRFDLILLDYDLPDIRGKEILSILDKNVSVVMITSNRDFGHESYNYPQIIDYLVKPIEFVRFYKAIEKVKKQVKVGFNEQEHFFIKEGNNLIKIFIKDVLYIKSAGNYLEFYMADRKVMTIMTLKEVTSKLTSSFQQIHRSYIVNIDKVDRVSSEGITISDQMIPLSKTYEEEFFKKLNLLN